MEAIPPEDQMLFSVALTILGCSGELSAREGRAEGGGEAAQLALTSPYLTLTLCCANPHTNAEIGLSTVEATPEITSVPEMTRC